MAEKDIGDKLLAFPEPKKGDFFDLASPADEKDHAQILEIIQDVLTMAPRRVDGVPLEPARKRVTILSNIFSC